VLTGGAQGPPGKSPNGLKEVLTVESATGLGSAAAATAARAAAAARLTVAADSTTTVNGAVAGGGKSSGGGAADHSGECNLPHVWQLIVVQRNADQRLNTVTTDSSY
jgi:hypothetical protein